MATLFFVSCSTEEKVEPDAKEEISAKFNKMMNSGEAVVCECAEYPLTKTVGLEPTSGIVQICNDNNNIYITYILSTGRLNQTRIGVWQEAPTSANPGTLVDTKEHPGGQYHQYVVPIGDLEGTIAIAAHAVIIERGTGGQNWAIGNQFDEKNPNSRYVLYDICEDSTPPPSEGNCSFSQGYWFAKPNVIWPGCVEASNMENCGTVEIGGKTYARSEAREIFKSSNKKSGMTDAKKAFLQAATIKLSAADGRLDLSNPDHAALVSALETIDAYFTSRFKATATNINNNNIFPANTNIRLAADILNAYIQENHCDNLQTVTL